MGEGVCWLWVFVGVGMGGFLTDLLSSRSP